MALPQFYFKGALEKGNEVSLDEEMAKHVVQVLRMHVGEKIQLTNGTGYVAVALISKAEKKKCSVVLEAVSFHQVPKTRLHLAVAFTKNSSRNEWLLEKATELGVGSIVPIISERTERETFRYDRWNNILISALLQSQQYYLPQLHHATPFSDVIKLFSGKPQKLAAHCIEDIQRLPLSELLKPGFETVVLIGPEGDFSHEEVNLCIENGFAAVSMGTQRLRTETAAMAVCAYFNLVNH